MLLDCACGQVFRLPGGAARIRRLCPSCGAILRESASGLPTEDLAVLKEKERALRDALRQRDRALRQAQVQVVALKKELDLLRAGSSAPAAEATNSRAAAIEQQLAAAQPRPAPLSVVSSLTRLDAVSAMRPVELPSDRLDLHLIPMVDEKPVEGAEALPSDRVPLQP